MTEYPGIPPHDANWLADLAAVDAGDACFFCAMAEAGSARRLEALG